jgi:hypothetical protein
MAINFSEIIKNTGSLIGSAMFLLGITIVPMDDAQAGWSLWDECRLALLQTPANTAN